MAPPGIKACDACRKAKRKCNKRLPNCSRCEERGLKCVYQPHPPFVAYGDAQFRRDMTESPWGHDNTAAEFDGISVLQHLEPETKLSTPLNAHMHYPSLEDLQKAWFLTVASWKIAPIDASTFAPIGVSVVKEYVNKVQEWLAEWVTKGQNPFVHRQLYAKRRPKHVQDAFTALSSYFSRTPETEDLILSTLEDRAEELVSGSELRSDHLDAFDHVSRVQALLIYSTIRLYDGDIRQRHLAEQHLGTLHLWTRQMLNTTAQAASSGALLISNAVETPGLSHDPSVTQETLLWHAWVLSESIRRTWLVAQFIRTIYNSLQHQCAECPGGVKFTTRKGVWEAESAFEWTKVCAERDVGLMHRSEARRLLWEGRPESCDPFSLAIMKIDFGSEQVERWRCS